MTPTEYQNKILKKYRSGDIERIDRSKDKDCFVLVYKPDFHPNGFILRSCVKKEWIEKLLDISVKDGNGFVYDGKDEVEKEGKNEVL